MERAQLLRRSATKRPGVVLLKPCFSSNTGVLSGSVGMNETKYSTKPKRTPPK